MIKNLVNKLAISASALIILVCAGNALADVTFIVKNNLGIVPEGEIINALPFSDISYQQTSSSVIFSANRSGPVLPYKNINGGLGIYVGSFSMGDVCAVTVDAVLTAAMNDPNNKPYAVDIPNGDVTISINPESIDYVCNANISSTDTVTVSVYKVGTKL